MMHTWECWGPQAHPSQGMTNHLLQWKQAWRGRGVGHTACCDGWEGSGHTACCDGWEERSGAGEYTTGAVNRCSDRDLHSLTGCNDVHQLMIIHTCSATWPSLQGTQRGHGVEWASWDGMLDLCMLPQMGLVNLSYVV